MSNQEPTAENVNRTDKFGEVVTHIKNVHNILDRVGLDINSLKERMKMSPMSSPRPQRHNRSKSIDQNDLKDAKGKRFEVSSANSNCKNRTNVATSLSHHRSTSANQPKFLSNRKSLSNFGSGEAPRKVGHREFSNLQNSFQRRAPAKNKQADGQEVSMSDQEPPRNQLKSNKLLEITRSPSNPRSRCIPVPRKKISMTFDHSTRNKTSQDSSTPPKVKLRESTSDLTQKCSSATQMKKRSRNRFLEARQSPLGIGRVSEDVKDELSRPTSGVANVNVKEIALPEKHQHDAQTPSLQTSVESSSVTDSDVQDVEYNIADKRNLLRDNPSVNDFVCISDKSLQVLSDNMYSPTTTGHSSRIPKPLTSFESLNTKTKEPLKSTSKFGNETSNTAGYPQRGLQISAPSKDGACSSEKSQSFAESPRSSKLPQPSSRAIRSPSRIPCPSSNALCSSSITSSSFSFCPTRQPQPTTSQSQTMSQTPALRSSRFTSDKCIDLEEQMNTAETANTSSSVINNPILFHDTELSNSFVDEAQTTLQAQSSVNAIPSYRKNRLRTKSCDDKKLSRINCSPYHKSQNKNRNYDAQYNGEVTTDSSDQSMMPNTNWLLDMTTLEQNSCDRTNDVSGNVITDRKENKDLSKNTDLSNPRTVPIKRPTPKPRAFSPNKGSSNFLSTRQITLPTKTSEKESNVMVKRQNVPKSPTVIPKASPRKLVLHSPEIRKNECYHNETPPLNRKKVVQTDLEDNIVFDEEEEQATPQDTIKLDTKCPISNDVCCQTARFQNEFVVEDERLLQERSNETTQEIKADEEEKHETLDRNATPAFSVISKTSDESDLNIYDKHLLHVSTESENRWREIEAKLSKSAFTNVSSWQWMHRNDSEKISANSKNFKVYRKRSASDLYHSPLSNMRTMSGASTPASITSLEVSKVLENKATTDKKKNFRYIVDSPSKHKLRSAQCSPNIKRLMSRFEDRSETLSFENSEKVKESSCGKTPTGMVPQTYATFSEEPTTRQQSKLHKPETRSGMLNGIDTPNENFCINRLISGKHSFESNSHFPYSEPSWRDSDSESFQSCSGDSSNLDSMLDCSYELVANSDQNKTHIFDELLSRFAFIVSKFLNYCLNHLRRIRSNKVVTKTAVTFLNNLPLITSGETLSKKGKENPWIKEECKLLWKQISIECTQLLSIFVDSVLALSHIGYVFNKLITFGTMLKEQFLQEVKIHREIMECNRSQDEVDPRYADILGQRVLEPRPASLVRLVRAYKRETIPTSYYSRRGRKACHYFARFAMHTLYNIAVMMASITVLWLCCSETSADDFFYHTEFYLNDVITFTRGPGHKSIH